MRTSTETNEISAALAKAQIELQNPQKNRTVHVTTKAGQRYSFDYATLDTILAHARPILGRNGLCLIQGLSDDRTCVTTRLSHSSGQWYESDTPVLVMEPGAKAQGGAITYARRYGVAPMLGLAAEEDDDGNAADGDAAEKYDRQPGARGTEHRPPAYRPPVRSVAAPAMREPGDDDEGPEPLPPEDDAPPAAAPLPPAKLPAPAPRAAKPVTHAAALGAAAALLPWIVEDAKSQHATCRKHPTDKLGKKIYLLRYEGNGSKGKWVKYNCPMKDPDGNERGYCKTSGFADEIFGEGAT